MEENDDDFFFTNKNNQELKSVWGNPLVSWSVCLVLGGLFSSHVFGLRNRSGSLHCVVCLLSRAGRSLQTVLTAGNNVHSKVVGL